MKVYIKKANQQWETGGENIKYGSSKVTNAENVKYPYYKKRLLLLEL
jgi:hypothetical protein